MSSNQIKSKERAIGKQAAKMAEAYIHQVLRQKLSIKGQGAGKMKPILEATKVRPVMGDFRLQGLNFTSSKIGFIQHYGHHGVRQGGEVYLKAARFHKNKTTRDAHTFNLETKMLFEDMYERSGALNYLLASLKETRSQALIGMMENMFLKINNSDGKK